MKNPPTQQTVQSFSIKMPIRGVVIILLIKAMKANATAIRKLRCLQLFLNDAVIHIFLYFFTQVAEFSNITKMTIMPHDRSTVVQIPPYIISNLTQHKLL